MLYTVKVIIIRYLMLWTMHTIFTLSDGFVY